MLFATAALAAAVALIGGCWSLRRASTSRAYQDAHGTLRIDGTDVDRIELVWALATLGRADEVADVLLTGRHRTIHDVDRELQEYAKQLSPREIAELGQTSAARERAKAELALFEMQWNSATKAAAVGGLDGLVIALGENDDWLQAIASGAAGNQDVSAFVGHQLLAQILPPVEVLPESLGQHLDAAFGDHVVEPLADVAGTAGLDLLGGVADAHIPLITIGRSISRARTALADGLESTRVAENVVLDVGLAGGGAMAGAAMGTAVFPVVGTVIGGVLGSLFGREAANTIRSRHLIAAREEMDRKLVELGNVVGSKRWRSLSESLRFEVARSEGELRRLVERLQGANPTYLLRCPRGAMTLAVAIESGTIHLDEQAAEIAEWDVLLEETSHPSEAYARGAILVNRPDLIERFEVSQSKVSSVISACARVKSERDHLALA